MYAFWCRPRFNLVAEVVWVALVAGLASAEWSVNDRAAVCVSAARVLNETRVDTLRVDARLVEGAVRIAAAPNRAFTPFADFSGVASRIGGTTIKYADAVSADVSVGAGLVDAALDAHHGGRGRGDGAVDAGVAHLVPGAGAGHTVVLGAAQGVDSAAAPLGARVAAGTLHARLVVRAVLVHPASHDAAVADANLLEPTILVCMAFHRHFSAVNLGIALVVCRTPTLGRVADGLAVGIDAAHTGSARILAELVSALQEEVAVTVRSAPSNASCVVTDFAPVAVIVRSTEVRWRALAPQADQAREAIFIDSAALALFAFELWVAIEAGWAEAVRAMMFRRTVRIDAAGSTNIAWVLALALIAALVDGAVLIPTAAIKASVRFTDFPKGTVVVGSTFDFCYASAIVARPLRTTVAFPAADVRVGQTLGVRIAQGL